MSKGTIIQYQQVFKLLRDFEFLQGDPILITVTVRKGMAYTKRELKYWNRFLQQFNRFLYQIKKCYDQYASSVYKVIRTFFRYLWQEKALPPNQFYHILKAPTEQPNAVIISPERLKRLVDDSEFLDTLKPALKRVRDLLVVGCFSGLRYSDLMNLKRYHLRIQENTGSLVLPTQKTGSEVTIPLPDCVIQIINSFKKFKGGFLLPRLSNTNFNIQVKQLARSAGWNEILPRLRHRQGRLIEIKKNGKEYRFCDHVTAHTMRRTAITCLLMMGVDEYLVRSISGHAPTSKEFHRYVVLVQSFLDGKIRVAHQKLLK